MYLKYMFVASKPPAGVPMWLAEKVPIWAAVARCRRAFRLKSLCVLLSELRTRS